MSRYPELGAAFSVIHANLTELDERQDHLTECRLAHLDEWVETALRLAGDDRDALVQLLDAWQPDRSVPLPSDVPVENREALLCYRDDLSVTERLCLLRAVIGRRGESFFADPMADTFDLSDRAADKIAYVQNSYSDNAYLQFSRTLTHPRAAYFDSFPDVCEEVYNGICEYGILPILHERDGKLFRFYSLLEKYDLRVVCACDVPTVERDGMTVTRYALIRKTLPSQPRGGTPTRAELLLPAEGADRDMLCDLLQAARACALPPERIDTRASEGYGEPGELIYQVTLSIPNGGRSLPTFLAFLSLEMPRVTVLGLYPTLSARHHKP